MPCGPFYCLLGIVGGGGWSVCSVRAIDLVLWIHDESCLGCTTVRGDSVAVGIPWRLRKKSSFEQFPRLRCIPHLKTLASMRSRFFCGCSLLSDVDMRLNDFLNACIELGDVLVVKVSLAVGKA